MEKLKTGKIGTDADFLETMRVTLDGEDARETMVIAVIIKPAKLVEDQLNLRIISNRENKMSVLEGLFFAVRSAQEAVELDLDQQGPPPPEHGPRFFIPGEVRDA